MEVKYYIDGVNFSQYGVFVSSSDGLLSLPKMKTPLSAEWKDYHGTMVDLSKKYYQPREIKLNCFITATSNADLVSKVNTFVALFSKANLRQLLVQVEPAEPLAYMVYSEDNIDVKKTWSNGSVVGTFTLALIEPEPVKRLVKYMRSSVGTNTVQMQYTTSKMVNIYWGDGSHTYDSSGVEEQLEHTYSTNGTFYIVITGDIDSLTAFQTNGTVVWNKF